MTRFPSTPGLTLFVVLMATACGGGAEPPTGKTANEVGPREVDAPGACVPGRDQTCNDDPSVSSLHGTCRSDGTCACHAGFTVSPATGRCR